jgi:hypothetical protein
MNVFNSHSPAHTPHKESDQSWRAKIHFGQTQQVALPQNNYGKLFLSQHSPMAGLLLEIIML